MKYFIALVFIHLICIPVYAQQESLQSQLRSLFSEKDSLIQERKLKDYEKGTSEMHLAVAINFHNVKGNIEKSDSLKGIAIQRFPQGDFAYDKEIELFQQAVSYTEKLAVYEMVLKKFKNRNLMMLYGMLATEAAKNRDVVTMKNTYTKIKGSQSAQRFVPMIGEALLSNRETNDAATSQFLEELLADFKTELSGKMINEKAPFFSLRNLRGQQVSLESLKGKAIVIDFWATWCKPCIQSFPAMQNAVDAYKNDPEVAFVFVNTAERGSEDPTERVNKFISDNTYTFNVLMDLINEKNVTRSVMLLK